MCPALFGYTDDTMRIRDAKAIMLGDVDMGAYGHLTIPLAPENPLNPLAPRLQPTWKPQSTLDLAGNRYQHALRWTLPLLRVGMDPAGNPESPGSVRGAVRRAAAQLGGLAAGAEQA